jgi:hypothetical protein
VGEAVQDYVQIVVLSQQSAIRAAIPMVASHGRLMHRNADWFVRRPRSGGAVVSPWRSRPRLLLPKTSLALGVDLGFRFHRGAALAGGGRGFADGSKQAARLDRDCHLPLQRASR